MRIEKKTDVQRRLNVEQVLTFQNFSAIVFSQHYNRLIKYEKGEEN